MCTVLITASGGFLGQVFKMNVSQQTQYSDLGYILQYSLL